ncbi:MAG: MiaB/RimO family radical SAM methylthiotransferase, partial [Firmicutes bacterium]|nr:MiaB/RimO family radical SAM methylthiotransferase [Bacillota bacterium]
MKVYIETLGCPKNEVDSRMAEGVLEGAGFEPTPDPAEAEVILVNTCAFIQDAKEESISAIFEMARYKEDCCRLLCVCGCLGQRYSEELFEEMPEADLIIGVNDYGRLPELIKEALQKGRTKKLSYDCGIFEEFPGITAAVKNASAYLKIAEGCNNCCTYCVIPQIRGGYRSREKENVLEEARALAAQGAEELVLIAQDVTNYGRDLYEGYELPDLLRDLAEIEGVRWIRLMYCYPDKITARLAAEIRDNPKVCKYIDMPVQHGSDTILKAMNRRSTKAQIQKVIRMLRKEVPGIVIRTTIIVGFPGERAAEFDEL